MRGKFIVLDGLDGIGKGVYLDAMRLAAADDGMVSFDIHDFWEREGRHPTLEEVGDIDLLVSSEPTYVGPGKKIREELIKTGSSHSAEEIAEAYAQDRKELYERVVLPALEKGIHVVQSRSVTTSLVYQPLDAQRKGEQLTWETVVGIPGNAFCLKKEHLMDAIIIPSVSDVNEVIKRLAARDKQDDATFETYEFQLKVKEGFEGEKFKRFFEERGVQVIYADADTSIEHSRAEAKRLYRELIGS